MLSFLPAWVRVEDGVVTISNVFTSRLLKDLRRIFRTTRIGNYLFKEVGVNSISFYEFFALEFYHLLDQLLSERNVYTSVRKIKQIQEALMEETWIGETEKDHPSIMDMSRLSLFKFTPLDYQEKFFHTYDQAVQAYKLLGMLLAAAPGTGKTYTTLATAECLESDHIAVFCQKSAIETVWLKSLVGKDSLYHKPPTVWSTVDWQPFKNQHVLVFHYEGLNEAVKIARELRGKRVTVILDESQNLNEMKALRSERYLDFCQISGAQNIIHASGTPIKALAIETVPLLRAIDPLFTEEVEKLFVKLYAGEASKMTEILARRLSIMTYKVDKKVLKLDEPVVEEVLVKVPNGEQYTLKAIAHDMQVYTAKRRAELQAMYPQILKYYTEKVEYAHSELAGSVTLPTAAREGINQEFIEYRAAIQRIQVAYKRRNLASVYEDMAFCNKFEKTMIMPSLKTREERVTFEDYKSVVKYMDLKIKGECLGRVLGKKRIEAFSAIAEHIPYEDITESTEKKTLVFTTYIDVVIHAQKILKRQGYHPLVVYGDHISDLPGIIKKFEDDKNSNPLIATYASLSTAVPMVMADTLIVVNPPYRDYVMQQTIARAHRLGANSQIRVFNAVLDTAGEPNISSRNVDIIEWSRKQANAVLRLTDDLDNEQSISLEEMVNNHEWTQHDPRFSLLPNMATW